MLRHRRKHSRAYGAIWDESTATPACIRVGQGASATVSSTLPANLAIIQSLMKRCVLNDAGVVQYYLDPTDSTLKENGDPANLDGTDGQVMVEIPLGWLKYDYQNNDHQWIISKEQFNGAERLDAFYKNDAWVKNRYMGAYEGILYDDSRSAYTNGLQLTAGSTDFVGGGVNTIHRDNESHAFSILEVGDKIIIANATDGGNNGEKTVSVIGDATITVSDALTTRADDAGVTIETQKDFNNDKLSSVSGKAPINYGTRANFRAMAVNRGAGWRQQDYDLVSAIQLLYLVEFANWDSQLMIGNGLTNWAGGTWNGWNDYNPIETAGNSNGDGNATANNSALSGNIGSYMSYQGIENFFGHIWNWVDGFNINNNIPYVCNNDTVFADSTSVNYTALGVTMHNDNGWVKTLEQISRGFLPASVGGSNVTYLCDYYWQSGAWRVARLGGDAYYGLYAGVASWSLYYSSGTRNRAIGGRLAF